MFARGVDNVAALFSMPAGWLGVHRITCSEAVDWVVSVNIYDYLAGDAMCFHYAPDEQLHERPGLLVGVHHVDADAAATDAGNQRAQRGRGASAATNDFAQIVGVHMNFDSPPAPTCHEVHPDIVRIVHDSADQMLNSVDDYRTHGDGQLSVVGSACSPPAAGASAAFSA
jgi:hypothetical protein